MSLWLLSGCGFVGLDELSADEADGVESPGTGGSTVGGEPVDSGGEQEQFGGRYCYENCREPDSFLVRHTFEDFIPPNEYLSEGSFIERSANNSMVGSWSLRTRIGGPGGEAEKWDYFDEYATGAIFIRTWLHLPERSVTDWIKVLGINGESTDGVDVIVKADYSLELFVEPGEERALSWPGAVPTSKWFCLQVRVRIGNDNGSAHAWIDGEHVVGITETDTLAETGLNNVVYGIGESGERQEPVDLFVDGYRVAREPIGCDE